MDENGVQYNIARLFIPGVSKYNNDNHDGAETIAEGWIAMRRGIKVPEDVVDLVNNHVERWKRQ